MPTYAIPVADGSPFPLQNIPSRIFSERTSVPTHVRLESLDDASYDISFNVFIARSTKESVKVSTSNYKHSYFTPAQCVAHRASSGCGLEAGERLGLGTISSPDSEWPDRSVSRHGCLFEMAWDGAYEVPDIGGTYIEDGD